MSTVSHGPRPGRTIASLAAVALVVGIAAPLQAQAFTVKMFRPWAGYAIPNGLWMSGDFNNDARADVFHAVASGDYAHIWTSDGNGGFRVSTFRPWPGYGIPNGVWLTGDFNNDHRTDVFHAVASGDYAHVWTSTGAAGNFAVSTFRPWPGYAIPNGVWLTGDFNSDGRTDVFHAVASGDYAHIWLSSGPAGTFTVGTFRPWSGYAIPNGVWLTGDFNGDGRTDIFHAVESGGYAHVWLSDGTGSFTLTTFRPWNGYAIPNGVWRTGDFDGDGRTDVFHAVASGGYAHVWRSLGNGSFRVTTFQPWPGYAIPNGEWLTGDVDNDGDADVIHAVKNTNYANVWQSNRNGSFTVSTFSPWNGYAIPNGLWLGADLTGDGKMDVFHAVASGDYAHPWLSNYPGGNEVAVDGIEVTQVVQDMAHTVTLLAGKSTVARVYLSTASPTPVVVTGRLQVRNILTGQTVSIASTGNATLTVGQQLRAKREALGPSLQFVIPAGFTGAGSKSFSLVVAMNAAGTVTFPCTNCAPSTRTVNFVASSPMRVRIVRLTYTTVTPGTPPIIVTNSPRPIDVTLTTSWLRRAYPAGTFLSSATTLASANTFPFLCGAANAELTTLRNNEIAAGTIDNRTHYVALVSNAGGYMRGCSPIPGTVASGPSGSTTGGLIPVNATGDPDNSFADWYAGHELGHSYNRLHPGFCNGNSSDDGSFPNPNGQISDNAGTFTGLDFGDAVNGIAMVVLPGASTFDIMTYCNQQQWMSAYAYEGIRARLNSENPAGTGAPAGGGARAARNRTKPLCHCALDVPPSRRSPAPIRTALKLAPKPYLGERVEPKLPDPRYREALVPPENQNRPDTMPVPAERFPAEVTFGEYPPTPVPPPDLRPVKERLQAGDLVSIVAEVNLSRSSATFTYVSRVRRGVVALETDDARASIRLRDSTGRILAEHRVQVRPFSDRAPGEDQTGLIDATLPLLPGVRLIELLMGDRVVASRRVSRHPPRVTALSARTRSAPEQQPDSGIELRWTAIDADGDSLTYAIEVRNERGAWETVAIRLPVATFRLPVGLVSGRPAGRIRVTANDGFHNSLPREVAEEGTGVRPKPKAGT